MHELCAGDRLDRYLLTDVLARTAMATVFKGHDTAAGAPVCVKVPRIECESDLVFHERFTREEHIARRLEHRNIVRAIDPGEKSRMYMVMEYVEGTSLRAVLRAARPSVEVALRIAGQLCDVLVYLHAQGIVHRDIKPENLIVMRDGQIKLLDFGIALDRAARRLTWSSLSNAVGTPDYMAPEQIGGRRGDARTDVYAVGMVLYEMLTGHLPYAADTPRAMMRAKMSKEPRPATWYVPHLDPGLAAIVGKAMARPPRDRFQTAVELLAALRDPQAAGRLIAGEVGVSERPRRPVLARVAVAALLAALASLTWISHGFSTDREGAPTVGAARAERR